MHLPDFAAGDATPSFNRALYLEHLEEASFLYEQRLGLYDDPEVTWLDIGRFEERLEAHIDALSCGGEAAAEMCQRHDKEGEPGALYAAVCAYCRQDRRDLLGAVLRDVDPAQSDRARAVCDAMKDEMPGEWAEALAAGLTRGHERLLPMLAQYLGYRRMTAGGAPDNLIDGVSPEGLASVIWSWGRVGSDAVASKVSGYCSHEREAVRATAAFAWLRHGDERAATTCRGQAVGGDEAMYLPLAVSGGRSDAGLLQKALVATRVTPDGLTALGVLGHVGAVGLLVEALADEELAKAATTALLLITGADLREEIFIPEAVHEDELFEDELQLYLESGEAPKHADGRPFGTSVQRTSQNPDLWRDWLAAHGSRFDPGQRYRLGQPFSLSTLVDTLVSTSFSRQVRALASEELVIRYAIDVAFEPEMRAGQQKKQINAIARACRANDVQVEPGRWYFGGRRI